jgi:predicted nucleotidyltransferase
MIPASVRSEINKRIERAEAEHGVRVLLAVESGSRAWGFESPNSDYDARFIYVHRQDWYLSVGLEEQRDVIEYEIIDDIDLNGWDLRKALRLFWKSNPAFVEWIQSSIIYRNAGPFRESVLDLLPTTYLPEHGQKELPGLSACRSGPAEEVLLRFKTAAGCPLVGAIR